MSFNICEFSSLKEILTLTLAQYATELSLEISQILTKSYFLTYEKIVVCTFFIKASLLLYSIIYHKTTSNVPPLPYNNQETSNDLTPNLYALCSKNIYVIRNNYIYFIIRDFWFFFQTFRFLIFIWIRSIVILPDIYYRIIIIVKIAIK